LVVGAVVSSGSDVGVGRTQSAFPSSGAVEPSTGVVPSLVSALVSVSVVPLLVESSELHAAVTSDSASREETTREVRVRRIAATLSARR
jgi:hypothetical protein